MPDVAVAADRTAAALPPVRDRPLSVDREPGEQFRPAARWSRPLVAAVLVLLAVVFMLPFLWLLSASLRPAGETFSPRLLPSSLQWANYAEVFRSSEFARWLFNSLLVGVLAAGAVVFSSSFVAFGFVYHRFPGRELVFALVLTTMMLPAAVTMVPTYLIWNSLHLVNTQVPLWATNLFGSAVYIFLFRQFYLGLPRELFDAARVDGANPLRTWWSIVLPLTRPALIAVAIFEFKASWANLMTALIYLRSQGLFTIPVGLKTLYDEFGTGGGTAHWEIVMAGSVLMTLPMIAIFFLLQKHFIRGVATTGLKG
jgi:multiple sugar transport system permease protein